MKVLAQPASATIIERLNSEFSYVHDKKRNKLGTDKGGRLVYIHHNLRVMNKLERFDYIEPAVEWDD
jgi:hypothetical protein